MRLPCRLSPRLRSAILAGFGVLCAAGGAGATEGAWPRRVGTQAPAAAPAAPAVAADAEVTVEGGRTLLTLTLSRPVAARTFLMDRPDRVVIDLPDVNVQIPAEPGRRKAGLISSWRHGLFAPGRSRLVIDLAAPATIVRMETSTREADGATLLTVEIAKADRDAFRRAVAADARAAEQASAPPFREGMKAEPGTDRRPLVVIDPGHGGVDPGAIASTGVAEKDIVFAFSRKLQARLEATGRYRVVMTRSEDVFIPLDDRVRISRQAKADLFISIHADTISGGSGVRGMTVYTGAERASDAESARVADRENRADQAGGLDTGEGADDIADILQELTMRETRGFSHRFAEKLIADLQPVMRLNNQPHREARFRVLRAPDVPAVLVELGYLSNRKDIDLLTSEEWRERSAAAMAGAVDRFFATRLARQGIAPVSP